jgi:hypothetical protein
MKTWHTFVTMDPRIERLHSVDWDFFPMYETIFCIMQEWKQKGKPVSEKDFLTQLMIQCKIRNRTDLMELMRHEVQTEL